MNYTSLKANIQDIVERTFTDDQLDMFTQQAEQLIYAAVQLPALRNNDTGTLTSGNQFLAMPTDMLNVHSLAVTDGSGDMSFLLNKDVNFIREAYPGSTSGLPKFYAVFDEDSFILGPTPDSDYAVEIHYDTYPDSIVTTGTTWLGDEFDSALLSGALLQAARFMQSEADVVQMYEKQYLQAIGLLKVLGDGKLRRDSYRSGQYRAKVT